MNPCAVFGETFAPTPRLSTIRLVIYLIASLSLGTFQLDVTSAFVQANLTETVFLRPAKETGMHGIVLKCIKSIYGLTMAGNNWYRLFSETLILCGLTQSNHDCCLFYSKLSGVLFLVLSHVDDVIMAGPTKLIQDLVNKLQEKFPTTGQRKITHYCGMKIQDSDNRIFISCPSYIDSCIMRFGIQPSKPIPIPSKGRLTSREEHETKGDVPTMQAMTGALLWISRVCRPDISFAVHELCKHTANPSEQHILAAEQILCYLKGTSTYGLSIKKKMPMDLSAYCDADYNKTGERKPTSGMVVIMNGVPVQWTVKSQTQVATSTFEAELTSCFEATREIVYWKALLEELRVLHTGPIEIKEDNRAVISFATHGDNNEKLKHLPTKYHYVKQCVREGKVRLTSIPTESNLSDILTKPLMVKEFVKFRELLQVLDCLKE